MRARARALPPQSTRQPRVLLAPERVEDTASDGPDEALQRLQATAGNRAAVAASTSVAVQRHPAHATRDRAPGVNRYEVLGVHVPPPRGGIGIPVQLRRRLEQSMGTDLGGVRLREDPSAADLDALAYTRGADIYLAPGHYQPHSGSGGRLIAHEVAHVIQQRAARVPAPRALEGLPVNEDRDLEREADRAARHAMWGLPAYVRGVRDAVHHMPTGVVQPQGGL
ncbi:MAG: DUF4157 domain-containing protein [Dehalococcoidia bacterium]